jgi:hypothetical protein
MLSNYQELKFVDCHYCENAMCSDATGWCKCYADGFFDHEVVDSKEEAEQCPFFSYCEIFPKC